MDGIQCNGKIFVYVYVFFLLNCIDCCRVEDGRSEDIIKIRKLSVDTRGTHTNNLKDENFLKYKVDLNCVCVHFKVVRQFLNVIGRWVYGRWLRWVFGGWWWKVVQHKSNDSVFAHWRVGVWYFGFICEKINIIELESASVSSCQRWNILWMVKLSLFSLACAIKIYRFLHIKRSATMK